MSQRPMYDRRFCMVTMLVCPQILKLKNQCNFNQTGFQDCLIVKCAEVFFKMSFKLLADRLIV